VESLGGELGCPFLRRGFPLPGVGIGRRSFGVNLPDMSDLSDLYVEVMARISCRLPHSTHARLSPVNRLAVSNLDDASSPEDPGSTMTPAEFLGLAWQAANAKARELG
jgi:hypothetical protein